MSGSAPWNYEPQRASPKRQGGPYVYAAAQDTSPKSAVEASIPQPKREGGSPKVSASAACDFAPLGMSPCGPERRLLRDSKMSGARGETDVVQTSPIGRRRPQGDIQPLGSGGLFQPLHRRLDDTSEPGRLSTSRPFSLGLDRMVLRFSVGCIPNDAMQDQAYFFTAASMLGPAFAKSSGVIAGMNSTFALAVKNQGSARAGICDTSDILTTMMPPRWPASAVKYAASGFCSAKIDWMICPSFPARTTALPAPTSQEILIRNLILHLLL